MIGLTGLVGLIRLVRLLAVGLVALLATTASVATAQEPSALADVLRTKFAADLETIARQADGVVGYVVLDVESGDRFARLDLTAFPTASTIKLAILYELLKQADEGRVAIDVLTPLDRSRAVPGGLLFELGTPSLSPRDLAVAMILESDNTATNVLIDRLGMPAVNQRMAAMGLSGIVLRRHMIDRDAALRGEENTATPADLARLVLAFHRGEGLSAESKANGLAILQKFKTTPIRTGVASGVAVASKSGELEGVRTEAGIVYVPGRPYVFVAMGTFLPDQAQPSRPLEQLARTSYEYFSRRATASQYGRQIR